MIKSSNRKKGVMIGVIVALVLIVTLGVTFAVWNYSRTTDNQILVAGDIYMKFTESNQLTIPGALPSEGPGENDYFEFTIEGKNTYSKPIWYEIDIQHGIPDGTRQTRIEDNLLVFKLVEVKENGQEEVLIEKGSYTGLAAGKGIYVNTIPAGTNDKITRTYRLYMWISSKTVIGNTSDADYGMDEWNDVYASIKVNVTGDFEEKEIKSEIGIDVVKDTLVPYSESSKEDFPGGLIAVNTDGGLYNETESSEQVREYRYSGPSVNNYIYFNCIKGTKYETADSNCETWRIIGVFKDESGKEHLKIVRNEKLSGIFPETFEAEGTTYNIKFTSNDYYAYWNKKVSGTNNNDWSTAGLQYWLNAGSEKYTKQPSDGYMSYLSKNAKSMIEETKYYLGTVTFDSDYIIDTTKEAYANERDVESCIDNIGNSESESGCKVLSGNKATWEGKIALMYPSDYGYSVSSENKNWEKQLKDFSTIESSSWMNSMPSNGGWLLSPSSESSSWLSSPSSDNSHYVAHWDTPASVNYYSAFNRGGVRPSVNLISEIKITQGNGTSESPYFLSE